MDFTKYHMMQRVLQTLLITVILLLVAGCGGSGSGTRHDASPEQQAERAYANGDYLRAANYWQREIDAARKLDSSGVSYDLKLRAADAWIRSREVLRATELLADIDPDVLNSRQRSHYFVVQADLAMQQNELQMAEFYMQAAIDGLPTALESYYAELQRNLINLTRDPSERSIEETAALSENLLSYDPALAVEMLQSLESIPSRQLQILIDQQQYKPEFTGWMELALQIRTLLINDRLVHTTASSWSRNHPGHPVNESNYADLVDRYRALYPVPAKVAVLLPTKGSLEGTASAIRDGIVSAYLDHPGDAELRFYASGDSPESAIAAYMQARNDGATQLIGPLDLDSTRALSTLSSLTTPILLLNDKASSASILNGADMPAGEADSLPSPPGNDAKTPARETDSLLPSRTSNSSMPTGMVNSLLLSQTEEAEAIAERALSQGFKRAVVFVPDTDWGTRVEQAFSSTFSQGNGRIIALSRFSRDSNDQSEMLTRLLRIEESKQRDTELRSWLGVAMDFEPSRRDDFDFIFMAASPTEGRELKPLLRFHDVGDVPVFAMGRVYSGEVDPTADQDLNGVVFPSTRWHLQAAKAKAAMPKSARGGAYGNYFALGEDAWRLLPWLSLMQKDRDLLLPGELGDLHLGSDGRVYREPAWAQFNSGKPTPYQWPDVH